MSSRRICSRPSCGERVVGRKLCRKHYQAAWKRGAFTNAPLPPRVPGRTICAPEHKHAGSSTCYIQHQCRCVPCKELHSQMENRRTRLKAYGRFDTGLVDAGPVRAHMMMLADFGMGYKRVAEVAGIGVTPTRNIILGRQDPGPRYGEMQKRVKRETAEALLAVRPEMANLAGGVKIPAQGTHRRVQALVTVGWSQSKLAGRLGIDPTNLGALLTRAEVTMRVHRAVEALFDELWNVLPPRVAWRDKIAYSRSVDYAKKRRWLPPLAWDDIDNDVEPPVAEAVEGSIDEMAVVLATQGEKVRLSPLERREVVRRLSAVKLSDRQIAERAHMASETVRRIRRELGIAAPVGADRQVVA